MEKQRSDGVFFSGRNAPWHLRVPAAAAADSRGEKIKKIPCAGMGKNPGIKVVNPRLAGKKVGWEEYLEETGRSGGKGREDGPCQTSKISASAICSGSGS